MKPIIELDPGHFSIDLNGLARHRRPWWTLDALLDRPISASLDPQAVGWILEELVDRSSLRDPTGRLLAWNAFTLRVNELDYRTWSLVGGRFAQELRARLEARVRRRRMQLDSDIVLKVEPDPSDKVERGKVAAQVAYHYGEEALAALETSSPDRTVRLRRAGATPASLKSERTERVQDAWEQSVAAPTRRDAAEASFRLLSGDQELARLEPGRRYVLGRGPGPEPDRIALDSSNARLSRRHLSLRVQGQALLLERFEGANPVHLDGVPVRESTRGQAPATLTLSNSLELSVVPA